MGNKAETKHWSGGACVASQYLRPSARDDLLPCSRTMIDRFIYPLSAIASTYSILCQHSSNGARVAPQISAYVRTQSSLNYSSTFLYDDCYDCLPICPLVVVFYYTLRYEVVSTPVSGLTATVVLRRYTLASLIASAQRQSPYGPGGHGVLTGD